MPAGLLPSEKITSSIRAHTLSHAHCLALSRAHTLFLTHSLSHTHIILEHSGRPTLLELLGLDGGPLLLVRHLRELDTR